MRRAPNSSNPALPAPGNFEIQSEPAVLQQISELLADAGYSLQSAGDSLTVQPEARPQASTLDEVLFELSAEVEALRIVAPQRQLLPRCADALPELFRDYGRRPLEAVALCEQLAAAGQRPLWLATGDALAEALPRLRRVRWPFTIALDSDGAHDLALLRTLPGATVAEPSETRELMELCREGLLGDGSLFVCRFDAAQLANAEALPSGRRTLRAGRGELLRDGGVVGIVCLGSAVPKALEAAERLEDRGLRPRVASARYLQALDRDLVLGTASRCAHLVVVEQGAAGGGFSAELLACLAEAGLLSRQLVCLGAESDAQAIAEAALRLVDRSGAVSAAPRPFDVPQRAPRVPTTIPVQLGAELRIDADLEEAMAANLSEGGMFLELSEPPEVGAIIHVEFSPQGRYGQVYGQAEVVWARPRMRCESGESPGVGVRFTKLDIEGRRLIRDFVALRRSRDALSLPRTEAPDAAPLLLFDLQDVESFTEEDQALHESVRSWVQGFGEVTGHEELMWRWCYRGVLQTALRSVDEAWTAKAHEAKVLAVMYELLVDDALARRADPQTPMSDACFDALLGVPFAAPGRQHAAGLSPADLDILCFGMELWRDLCARMGQLPRYSEFADHFEFDLQQLVLRARYRDLLRRRPDAASATEQHRHVPQSTGLLLSADIDLMASSSFDARELGSLREVLALAQEMAHLVEVLAHWEQDLMLGRSESLVLARARAAGVISAGEDWRDAPESLVRRVREAGVPEALLAEWSLRRDELARHGSALACVDQDRLLEGLEALVRIHLGLRD